MLALCIREQEARYGLYRLGVTMHVYADTWAHQGFAGVNHRVNDIRALDDHDDHDGTFLGRIGDFFGDTFDRVTSSFVTGVLPLGHGRCELPGLPLHLPGVDNFRRTRRAR